MNIYIKSLHRPRAGMAKILLVMKLIVILLTTAILQVSASSYGQKISLSVKNAPLDQVLKKIKEQSGINVVYYTGFLDKAKRVNLEFKELPLVTALDQVFKNQPLTYELKEGIIVLKVKEPSFLDRVVSAFASIDVHGTVLDETGNPLVGATLKVKGLSKSTKTNEKGEFFLAGVEEDAVLVISYLGYESKEINAAKDLGKVQLVLADSKLEEVIINAGYYTVTDKERTGSISKVTAKTIEQNPVNNPLQAIQNRVPGVVITQMTGVPGGGVTVQIRGKNSISNGTDPLYIIDGVIYPSIKLSSNKSEVTLSQAGANPLSMISPDDIASFEILKDADATAIYGSKGANGVILITTKRGQQGKTRISGNVNQGFGQVAHRVKLLNTEEYLQMRREAFKNDGLTPGPTDYDLNGAWDQNQYTDWQKELIGGTAHITNGSVSVSGGSVKTTYLLGGNYYREGTVYPGNLGFHRGGAHTAINFGSTTDRFNASFTASYSDAKTNLLLRELTGLILLAPNHPRPYNEYGKLNWGINNTVYRNPMSELMNSNNATTSSLIGNLTIKYEILKSLTFKTSLSYTDINREEHSKSLLASRSPALTSTAANRVATFSNNYNHNWMMEPQLAYKVKLGPGIFDALAGMSIQENKAEYRTIKGTGYSSDDLMETIAGASVLTNDQMLYFQYRYIAGFARLNYNLLNRYYLNLTARRDGSSRFGEGKQFANFGAIGGAWIFSDEKIIKDNLPFLSFGKLRASYGITGNDQILDYGYLQLWDNSAGTYQGQASLTPTRIANPNYAWETNRKAEIGLQMGFLKDHINLEVSYYRNRSSNQLVGMPIPWSTGFNSIQANLPAEVQNTGWEFDSSFKLLKSENWGWSCGLNLTIPRNKLLSYPGLATSANVSNYVVGQPLTIKKSYNTYVNPQTGLYTFEDMDGNGTLNVTDQYVNKFIGQYFYGGIQNSLSYQQFSLDFLISFVKQNGNNYLNGTGLSPGYFDNTSSLANQVSVVLNRWQNAGDPANIQKFSTTEDSFNAYGTAKVFGGLSIADASYLRLKNVSFAYRLPKRYLSALKITNAEINLQGQNVFTVTRYTGLDPESQSLVILPPLRIFSIGVKLTF